MVLKGNTPHLSASKTGADVWATSTPQQLVTRWTGHMDHLMPHLMTLSSLACLSMYSLSPCTTDTTHSELLYKYISPVNAINVLNSFLFL
jgi:hypothetical protein